MNTKHSGSCLCGEVEYLVEGNFEHFYLCHCEYCRKDTGSAHAANLFSSSAKLTWLNGQDKTIIYRLDGTRHAKCFCSTCGSALPQQSSDGKLVMVPAGSLDSSLSMKPQLHLFNSSRADWDHELESVPVVEKLPA
ncbi:GFA family protein [Dongshaea marina]|uniref:GFA family protein n=1 Tax=Dongshaea marina TaxID=2047966 RepID=UPI000D3E2B4B|nr:GFA family protein [Dongshaea marina]